MVRLVLEYIIQDFSREEEAHAWAISGVAYAAATRSQKRRKLRQPASSICFAVDDAPQIEIVTTPKPPSPTEMQYIYQSAWNTLSTLGIPKHHWTFVPPHSVRVYIRPFSETFDARDAAALRDAILANERFNRQRTKEAAE